MTERPETPDRGKRGRGRTGPASPHRRPKPASAGSNAKKHFGSKGRPFRGAPPSGGRDHGDRRERERGRRGGGDENRIAKVMARAGLCSRRDAEEWIAAGRVAVNGGIISSPAINVTERDRITVDGEPLPRRERTRLFLYHKPAGLVSTNVDPEGRPTLFDALPKNLPRLMSVGRLDIGTEGLLLLTNDGGLARELELPETGWVRRYRVRAHGHVSQGDLDRLRDGVTVEGIHYGPIEATLERDQGTNVWLSFAISEGKNREVRNVLRHLGVAVNRLIRVEFGPFGLGTLPEGEVEEVQTGNLRIQLGPHIIARAGCDFSGPATPMEAPSREERRVQRHALRGRLHHGRRGPREADRDDDEGRPFRESGGAELRRPATVARWTRTVREREEAPEKPQGRPRRGHAWRQDDAPLRRTYRGSRRDDLRIGDEERPDKRTSVTSDRKGRSIVVERFGSPTEERKPAAAMTPGRQQRRGPPRDRASGPRPSRPHFVEERSHEPRDRAETTGPGRPRKFSARADDRRNGKPEQKPAKQGSRHGGPRADSLRPRGQRPHGQRSDGPRTSGPHPSGRPRKH